MRALICLMVCAAVKEEATHDILILVTNIHKSIQYFQDTLPMKASERMLYMRDKDADMKSGITRNERIKKEHISETWNLRKVGEDRRSMRNED